MLAVLGTHSKRMLVRYIILMAHTYVSATSLINKKLQGREQKKQGAFVNYSLGFKYINST